MAEAALLAVSHHVLQQQGAVIISFPQAALEMRAMELKCGSDYLGQLLTYLVACDETLGCQSSSLRCVRGDLLLVTAFVFLDESKVRVLCLSVFFPSHALPPLACSALGLPLAALPRLPPAACRRGSLFSVLAAKDWC